MFGDYETFKRNYFRLSEIDLSSYKEAQMKRRIDSFISKQDVKSYEEFITLIRKEKGIYEDFIAYLTINVSEFYRNPTQWKTLEKHVIPGLMKDFGKPLKIWSAACSTGDEPYSLAMVLSDFLPLNQIQIMATDLDVEVLSKAKEGVYSDRSLKGLPERYRKKYLVEDGPGKVRVSNELKSCITFKQHNLLKDPYPKGMHMIVCRNVMIYFTEEAKDIIYQKFSDSLQKKGVLFVGSTEQIIGSSKYGFQSTHSFFYQKD